MADVALTHARIRGGHRVVVLLYAGLTGFFCFGIVTHPLSRTPLFGGDGFVTFWNYWWARQSLLRLHTNPLHTTYLTHPHDVSLVFHSHDLLHGILSIPFQWLVPGPAGLALGVNVILLLCFFLSALAMYWCTWTITRCQFAAAVAGFGYGFSALHVGWRSMPVIGALYWLPLFTWLFLRAVRVRRGAAWLLPGLCFGLCTFQSLYYTLFLGILSVFLSIVVPWAYGNGARLLRHIVAIDAAVLLCGLPMAAVVAADLMHTTYESPERTVGVEMDCRTSLDVVGLVIPGPEQGFWGTYARPLNEYLRRPTCHWPLFGLNGVGGEAVYIGIVPLLLAGYAWRSGRRREVIGWSACALGCLALALGPNLHVAGFIFRSVWLPLPYRLSWLGPSFFSSLFHEPWLFYVPALFAIWTLAAIGLSTLMAAGRWQRRLVCVLVLAWLIFDFAAPPFRTDELRVPSIYARIAADPRPVAVWDILSREFVSVEYLNFLQTVHGKPILRGYMARKNMAAVSRDEMLGQAAQSPPALEALLQELGPAYVIVHKAASMEPADRGLATMVGERLPKTYEDAEVAVYAWRLNREQGPAEK